MATKDPSETYSECWYSKAAPSRQTTDTTVCSDMEFNHPKHGSPVNIPFHLPGSPDFWWKSRSSSNADSEWNPSFTPNLDSPLLESLGRKRGSSDDGRQTARRLAMLQERRGWKYWFRHVAGIPLALVVGFLLGLSVSYLYLKLVVLQQQTQVVKAPAWPYELAPPPSEVPWSYFRNDPLDNSCLLRNLVLPSGKNQTFDACAFVIESTDKVWNLREDVDANVEKYFHEDYIDAGSWGKRIIGKYELKKAIWSEMRAFPDIQIHITDCICKGNDDDGYKCAMPDVLTGTNLGPSSYGPATGKFAKWTGLVESWVKRDPKTAQWQYVAEWGVHDEWSLIQQLGLDFNRVPHLQSNIEPLHDCKPLVDFTKTGDTVDMPDWWSQHLHRAEGLPS